jgi:hypothetical protein
MLPTESGCNIGEDSECKPGGAAERRGEPRAAVGERCACELANCKVRTGEASKVCVIAIVRLVRANWRFDKGELQRSAIALIARKVKGGLLPFQGSLMDWLLTGLCLSLELVGLEVGENRCF